MDAVGRGAGFGAIFGIIESDLRPISEHLVEAMKVQKLKKASGKKETLLREYFLNAYLIALLKQAGNEVALKRKVATESTKDILSAA